MITDESIFEAYYDCLRNKRRTYGAMKYLMGMEEDLIALADEVNNRSYAPSVSVAFVVLSPKRREVFAACFRDRIIHHWIALRLEPLFEEVFGDRTFNCRKGKGVLFGINTLREDIRLCSDNYTTDCWIMKMDLKGFFMSINKSMMWACLRDFILTRYKGCDLDDLLYLTEIVVMHSPEQLCVRKSPLSYWEPLPREKSLFTNGDGLGVPIGNLSSQHFANFFLHHLDVFIEDVLGFKHHGRYVDDFYIIGRDKAYMLQGVARIREFLLVKLGITLHPQKFYIQHYSKGVSFTGAVIKFDRVYPGRRMTGNLRSAVYRLNKAVRPDKMEKCCESVNSYLGSMVHMKAYAIRRDAIKRITNKCVYVKGRCKSVHLKRRLQRKCSAASYD